jgi:hypothetical protein
LQTGTVKRLVQSGKHFFSSTHKKIKKNGEIFVEKNILLKCHGINIAESIGFKPQAGLY